jgi:ATP-dependent RNA helicase DeaD
MQKKLFSELGLPPEILKAVEKMGFEEASPIQSAAIPVLLGGSDVVGQSQTGSGKTAAFAIPAIEKVDGNLRAPQVLILCPTRELAVQVAEEVAKLALFKRGVRELPIYGGASYDRQLRGLHAGAQIIIGTPGRVMDHLERKTLKLDAIKMVILDEADRMLDMGFREDIETILKQSPPERQTVLFSATVPRPIAELIKKFTRSAVNVQIEQASLTVTAIDQVYYEVDRRSKLEVLCRLIDLQDVKFALIFCATKMMCDELTEHLTARGYGADKLHGDMTQQMRERVMKKFREKKIEFLVATDVAARGLDVDDIEVVFNYDLPHDGEDYVHRIGRTGRAGRTGKAVTFVAGREIYKMQNIIRFTRGKIRREKVPSLDEVEEKRTSAVFEHLRETLEAGEYVKRDAHIDRLLDSGHSPTDIANALLHMLAGDGRRAGKIAEDDPRNQRRDEPARGLAARDFTPREYPKYEPKFSGTKAARAPREPREEAPLPRGSREIPAAVAHEPGMVRLVLNCGRANQIQPGDIVGVIAGVTRIDRAGIGAIHIQPKETLVDVAEAHVKLVLKKLNGVSFKGRKLHVSVAV